MLDEPTNHLDLESGAWRGDAQKYGARCCLISHDRYFMNQVAISMGGVGHALNQYGGNYDALRPTETADAPIKGIQAAAAEMRATRRSRALRSFNREKSIIAARAGKEAQRIEQTRFAPAGRAQGAVLALRARRSATTC